MNLLLIEILKQNIHDFFKGRSHEAKNVQFSDYLNVIWQYEAMVVGFHYTQTKQ